MTASPAGPLRLCAVRPVSHETFSVASLASLRRAAVGSSPWWKRRLTRR